jgi:opacity protein-like surface antigen
MAATTVRRTRIAATASAVLLGSSLLAAGAAQATAAPQEPPTPQNIHHPAKPYGIVTAKSGLNVRQYPSTDSSVKYVLPYKAERGLDCKVRAQYIKGNTVWYKLRHSNYWISARYVHNVGYVDYCKNVRPSAMNDSDKAREAMG